MTYDELFRAVEELAGDRNFSVEVSTEREGVYATWRDRKPPVTTWKAYIGSSATTEIALVEGRTPEACLENLRAKLDVPASPAEVREQFTAIGQAKVA